jgi:hypothetical protein
MSAIPRPASSSDARHVALSAYGPISDEIDLSGHLVVIDLSALYTSPALGLLMTCATAWLQAGLQKDDGIPVS